MNLFVITPMIGWTWPAVWPIATAVAAGMGYKRFSDSKGALRGRTTRKLEQLRREVVPLDGVLADVIGEELGNEERIQFQRDELILVFRKDARGKFFVEVAGPADKAALDLKLRAEAFAVEMVKKFAYHKLAEQLVRTGAVVYEERIEENGRITLRARKWR
jgi:hypothetical protein